MTSSHFDSSLADYPLFYGVEDEIVRKFLASGFRFQYEAGTPMIANNDLGESFFLILQGLAKLVLVNKHQEEVNIALFRAGDFFGELAILEPQHSRSANVISMTPVEVLVVQKADFLKLMHQHPTLILNIARVLGQRLRAMNVRMSTEQLSNPLNRVAQGLLQLCEKGTVANEQGAILLPHLASLKDWALFCSTTTDAFMDSMEQLKQARALEWQKQRILITNRQALQECADPSTQHPTLPGGAAT